MRQWLIEKRLDCKMSQKNIAEKIGISQPSYCNIENGDRRPSVDTAKKIGEVLGFDWTRFYEEEGKKESKVSA